jgi:hypothetical protein
MDATQNAVPAGTPSARVSAAFPGSSMRTTPWNCRASRSASMKGNTLSPFQLLPFFSSVRMSLAMDLSVS